MNRDALGFLTLAALWGTAFVATKAALAEFPPVLLAALRFDIAAAVLVAVAVASGARLRPAGWGDFAPILAGGTFSIGLHHALLFTGQQYVPSAVAATLLGLIPVLTPVAARVVRPDERIDTVGAVGLLVGFAGLILIADPDVSQLARAGDGTARATGAVGGPALPAANLGALFVFASAVAWVAGAVTTREDDATLGPLALQAWMAAVGALLLHVAAGAVGQSALALDPSATGLAWLAYLAVVPGAAGFLLYFRLLDRIGPIRAGLLEYAIPPFAALFGFLVLGETLAEDTVVGFACILSAFLLVQRVPIRAALRRRLG
ncbi:DMT family transporter [Halobaculum gomorrense]|uniref:Permease of the drug/metabolite transporter (DMT) superfamily n=1 Tax=Halobaculum gomorrense TaxID=43928 RepID=A0A1M5U4I9_9EURY|nr:DMT family transporter [Halobaculum gomorrense]SHH57858.1 Permease of the drug/metabolite transporter (DMT) superfamily [Halobaculum gomorrense]